VAPLSAWGRFGRRRRSYRRVERGDLFVRDGVVPGGRPAS
jgi:hypothetical protein